MKNLSDEEKQKSQQPMSANQKRWLELSQDWFGDVPVAFADQLWKGWEFLLTRILNKFFPRYTKKQVTVCTTKASEISYLDQQNFELSYLTYHSVAFWYRNLRLFIMGPLLFVIFLIFMLAIGIFFAWGIAVFGDGYSSTAEESFITFTPPISSDYLIAVHAPANTMLQNYGISIYETDNHIVEPVWENANTIWPLAYGQTVYSKLTYRDTPHLYRVPVKEGDILFLSIDEAYANVDLELMILDARVQECGSVSVLETHLDTNSPPLLCTANYQGDYFVSVDYADHASLLNEAPYSFSVLRMLDISVVNQSGDVITPLEIGDFQISAIDSAQHQWYQFTATANTAITIVVYQANLTDARRVTATLHPFTPETNYNAPLAVSQPGYAPDVNRNARLVATSRGRADVLSRSLKIFGIDLAPSQILGDTIGFFIQSLSVWIMLIPFLVFLIFDKHFMPRKYNASLVIWHILRLMAELDDENILQSEIGKEETRLSINLLADQVKKIHKIPRIPTMGKYPRNMERYFNKMSQQIRDINNIVSAPQANSLVIIRAMLMEWGIALMKGEYGAFAFQEDFKETKVHWHEQIAYFVGKKWGWILGFIAVILLAFSITQANNPAQAQIILISGWLLLRYLILVIFVFAAYNQWGVPEEANSQWQNAARFILFFILPLIALDAILQTGIVNIVIQFIGNLNIF